MNIEEIMEKWQNEMMNSDKLFHVTGFQLSPQSDGFMLKIEHTYPSDYDRENNFYGTLKECFNRALEYIEEEKNELFIRL